MMILTKGELRRREEAVVAGFIERDGDKAFEHVQELIKVNANDSDKIKQDQELIEAYEDILEILINLNYEQAAVILDEFRIH